MRAVANSGSEVEDGALLSHGIDSPRFCAGALRVVGVKQIDARHMGELREIASDLRSRGFERSRDGVLSPGVFDLVFHRNHYLALFVPHAFERRALA